jgi:hypothetical protein
MTAAARSDSIYSASFFFFLAKLATWRSISSLRLRLLYIEGFSSSERTAQEGIPTGPTVRDLREKALMAISSWLGSAKEGPSSRGRQCFRASEDGIVSLGTKKFGTFNDLG